MPAEKLDIRFGALAVTKMGAQSALPTLSEVQEVYSAMFEGSS